MTDQPSEFGDRRPSPLWQWLVSCSHHDDGPFLSRLVAPIARKLIAKQTAKLPIDLQINGINLRCQFTDNYSEKKFVFTPWRFDQLERDMISKAVSGGGTFIDIGANVGLYTLTAARAMGDQSGTIIAFEPNPVTLERLRFNIAANPNLHPDRIHVFDHGIADQETSFVLHSHSGNLGKSSINKKGSCQSSTDHIAEVTIRCRPLLTVLNELGIETIDILKIDIEGAEDIALGPFMENAPESLLPQLVIIENSENQWQKNLFQMILDRGYSAAHRNKMNSVFTRDTVHFQ